MTNDEHLDQDEVVELMVTQSETEANIVRGLLEESGIECAMVTQVPHNIYPFTVDGLATIQIKVLDSQLETARTLLRDHIGGADQDEGGPPEETGGA